MTEERQFRVDGTLVYCRRNGDVFFGDGEGAWIACQDAPDAREWR